MTRLEIMQRCATQLLLLCATGSLLVGTARADVVRIHNRGDVVRLEGAEAEELSRIAVELFRAASERDLTYATEVVRALREHEVAVELQFDEPLPVAPQPGMPEITAEYLFFTITGDAPAPGGEDARILIGRRGKVLNTFGFPFASQPDEYGIQYFVSLKMPPSLDPLRAAVAKFGIVAERPTPRPQRDPKEDTREVQPFPTVNPEWQVE